MGKEDSVAAAAFVTASRPFLKLAMIEQAGRGMGILEQ